MTVGDGGGEGDRRHSGKASIESPTLDLLKVEREREREREREEASVDGGIEGGRRCSCMTEQRQAQQ